ncbi:hypothetical protein [Burkholderia cenocepacia]|uniref:hypothetical protein n=1 Tax=Burkholderia cenocepacia TaxID=95486 RepID=UPI0007618CAB|nr:hypothetical protein [Burkholderia cenocepacia]KWU19084.1 hypothetical protein AS149_12620 [Burkholderia cenocepacia]
MSKKTKPVQEVRHEFSLHTNIGIVSIVLNQHGRTFRVERLQRDDEPESCVGFHPSGPGIENLDTTSDAYDVFGISTRIRTADATLGTSEMRAYDIDSLRLILKKVKFASWNHEAI